MLSDGLFCLDSASDSCGESGARWRSCTAIYLGGYRKAVKDSLKPVKPSAVHSKRSKKSRPGGQRSKQASAPQ